MKVDMESVGLIRKSRFVFRQMQIVDLGAVHAIQEERYPETMQESMDVIARRLHAANETCWVAEDCMGLCGYLFAYPSMLGAVTQLDGDFSIPADPDTLYLHDLAASRRVAGQGVGDALFALAMATARDRKLPYSGLVAVQGACEYWARSGYAASDPAQEYRTVVRGYPAGTIYMVKRLY